MLMGFTNQLNRYNWDERFDFANEERTWVIWPMRTGLVSNVAYPEFIALFHGKYVRSKTIGNGLLVLFLDECLSVEPYT